MENSKDDYLIFVGFTEMIIYKYELFSCGITHEGTNNLDLTLDDQYIIQA